MTKAMITIIMFLFTSMALAIDYDVTGDSQVDIDDVIVLAANWLSTPVADPNCDFSGDGDIDLIDYALLVDNWSGEYPTTNIAPVASNIEISAYTAEVQGISFVATDADGDSLAYKIQSLPLHGKLIDISIGAGYVYTVPYTIQSNIDRITYKSDISYTGADNFTYTVYDGIEDANTATVDIDVVTNILDNLTFNGQGYITVPDSAFIEFDSNFSFALWFKTKWPYGVLFSKHSSGAGIEGRLVDGRPVVSFFDTSGNVKVLSAPSDRTWKCNTGEWTHLVISHNKDGNFAYESDSTLTTFMYVNSFLVVSSNDVPDCDFYNDIDLVIGAGQSRGFKGEIDRVSWYSTALDSFSAAMSYYEGRNGADGGLFIPNYFVRFNLNEGTGVNVNDMTYGLIGTINNADDVQWATGNSVGQKLSPKLRHRERFRPDTFHFRDYRGSNGY